MPAIKPRFVLQSNGKSTGWRPDIPSPEQDWKLSKKLGALPRKLPDGVFGCDPETWPRIRDQDVIGSCGGHAGRSAIAQQMRAKYPEKLSGKWGTEEWDVSPLALYYLARREDNCEDIDSGVYLRHVADALRKYGVPTEKTWPYDISKFTREPSAKAMAEALWHQAHATSSFRCDEDGDREKTVSRIIQAHEAKLPVIFGFACFPNLSQADRNGVIPLPTRGMKAESGHAMVSFRADVPSRHFIGPNSWGDWGMKAPPGVKIIPGDTKKGYFALPFEYFTRGLADDAWAIAIE